MDRFQKGDLEISFICIDVFDVNKMCQSGVDIP